MTEALLRKKLAAGCRILEAEKQGEMIWGHASARLPDDPGLFLMKPHLQGFDETEPSHLIIIDLDGNVVAGDRRRHGEVFIHSEIYRARPDVQAVVHTHPPHAVVFGALGKKMQPIGNDGALFSDGLPVFGETTGFIVTPALGAAVARTLAGWHSMLLRNHGIVTTGGSIEVAVLRAIFLDRACRVQLLAESCGGAVLVSSEDEARAKRGATLRDDQIEATFDYLVRTLK
jgi:L-ribulose-5-phosphate 4-epimerase